MSQESEEARDEKPDTPEATGGASGSSSEKPAASSASGPEADQERNDLIIEHWQAPKPDRMKGDGREIWEFESEKVRPSRALWFNLFAIVLTLAGGLALIIYGIWRLSSTINP